ncbi:unnamed protein product [Coregonus sp. 'balchen']|nr:unnamed protein product [Coregonus sp. 'balchen']
MEWLWIQVLCFLVLTDLLWTLPISKEQWPRPEDMELAEFLWYAFHSVPNAVALLCVSGSKYWVVRQLKMKSHFGSIYDFGFPARVRNIDAAIHISEYGKTFFKDHDYYIYDEHRHRMDPGFPRNIKTDWPGTIYLFSGTKAYNYDYRQNWVLSRILANAWLGC